MDYGSHQPHIGSAMSLFAPQWTSVDDKGPMGYAPIAHFNPAPPFTGMAGLGDWFSDGLKAVTGSVTDVVGTLTGQKAQQEAQRNALALAQIQAQRAAAESAATGQMVMYGALGIGAVALIVLALRR